MNVLELLQKYQLNIMFSLTTICAMLTLFIFITKTLAPYRKRILMLIELCAMFLLIFDRFSYFFRGNTSDFGFWMVRISNFCVFLLTIGVIFVFTLYLIDVFCIEGSFSKPPLRLKISCILCVIAAVMLIISQFTGLYYTFDEFNQYQRSDYFAVCYLFPLIILILDLSAIIEYYKRINKLLRISLLLFSSVPLLSSIVQIWAYGISLTNMTLVGMAVMLYVFALLDMNDMVMRANKREIEIIREEQQHMRLLFEQTATALANAIDAKDKYTHGHSRRVAEYSVKIAKYAGKSEKVCEDIYFAGLLHDVGKIGIKDSIINKDGRLTDEEYAVIKTHPVIGMQILSSISQSPYLSIGAHYHHERYDGKGYPEKLKGEDIPDIARIIAVADAYDAMTSKRSYRDPIPQQLVREEFVKGAGAQFDPNYAKIMLHLIDKDLEYNMKEHTEVNELGCQNGMICGSYRSAFSDGILLTDEITHIHLRSRMGEIRSETHIPSIVLFDSLDGHIHEEERKQKDLLYFEYVSIRTDGLTEVRGARAIQTETEENTRPEDEIKAFLNDKVSFDIEAVRYKDHVLIRISNQYRYHKMIIALPDSTRFCYLSLTGEHCTIDDIDVTKTGEKVDSSYIPRIAEEISYINVPAGDIPNVQVDGWCSAYSEGIKITDGMRIRFHSMSLPTARLVWHCPFAILYAAEDGKVNGKNYRELTVVRLDGEGWEEDNAAENIVHINKLDSFTDWNKWKEMNKAGQECELLYHIEANRIVITTKYCGLSLKSVTTVSERFPMIYTALTGDQCAITNVKIIR